MISRISRLAITRSIDGGETWEDITRNQGLPAVHLKGSDVSEAYKDVVDRFMGQDKPMRFVDAQKQGFLKRLFGSRA